MVGQIGKVDRPSAHKFEKRKKIYLVPLVYHSDGAPDDYKKKCNDYWQQVASQLNNLEVKIGKITHVYHESITMRGEEGLKVIKNLNSGSYHISKNKCDNGAVLEVLEQEGILAETMDWERCLFMGLMSEKVANKIYEFYTEASKKRYEMMAEKLGETLGEEESGLLFIREGHNLQFPDDVEVFSVFPPALDDIHRWLRDRSAERKGKDKKDKEDED